MLAMEFDHYPSIISGWLKKRKQQDNFLLPNWNQRWVSVQNDRILWRHSKDIELAGIVELQHVESVYKVEILEDASSNKGRIFVVKSRKKTICFMAQSESECDRWVRCIQLQLDLRNGGTVLGPPTVKNRRKSNGGGDHFENMMKRTDDTYRRLSELSSCSQSTNTSSKPSSDSFHLL